MKIATMFCAASLGLLAATQSAPAHADDVKFYSVGGCAPYTTGTPDYNLLRIRSESVQNQSNAYLYVICPIIRDTEDSWNLSGGDVAGYVSAYFRTNTAGTFQCTLNLGSNRTTVYSETKDISGNPGDLLTLSWADPSPPSANFYPVSLVCRLPPKGSIVNYEVREVGDTDTNNAP